MKALKQLNGILHFMDDDEFEEFRICQSMCTNTTALEGKLCLSIHPLDYMTMSDNACDWSSCMSWQEDGCYRMGTVEMMNSPCVIVAYLESSHPMYFSREATWNSKNGAPSILLLQILLLMLNLIRITIVLLIRLLRIGFMN